MSFQRILARRAYHREPEGGNISSMQEILPITPSPQLETHAQKSSEAQ